MKSHKDDKYWFLSDKCLTLVEKGNEKIPETAVVREKETFLDAEDAIKKALLDILDGIKEHDLQAMTGLSEKRCQEIFKIKKSLLNK